MRQRPILTVAVSISLLAGTIAGARPLAVPGDVDSPPEEAAHGARHPELNGPVAPPAIEPSAADIDKSPAGPLNGAEWLNKGPGTEPAAESGVEDETARPDRTIASSTAASGRHSKRRRPTWRPPQADAKAPEPPPLLAPPVATAETTTGKAELSSPVAHVEPAEPRAGEPGLFPIQKDAAREWETTQNARAFLCKPEGDVADEAAGETTPPASRGIELTQPRSNAPPAFKRDQHAPELSEDKEDVGALLGRSPKEQPDEESGNPPPERPSQRGQPEQPGQPEKPDQRSLTGPAAEDEVGDGQAAEELELGAESADAPRPAKPELPGAKTAEEEIAEAEIAHADEAAGTTKPPPQGTPSTDGAGNLGNNEADKPAELFSPRLLRLRDSVRECLTYYDQRPERVHQRSPWGIMHSVMAYGVDAELQAGRDRVTAIGWLCYNRPCRQLKLFQFDGRYPVPRNGPGYQGHKGQFLSILALSRVKSTYPMRVAGRDLAVQDLIEYEKATCRSNTELTFKLIGLAHYLPSDATWRSKWGRTWSIARLLQEELAQPIHGAACGGTHRLIGYSVAVKKRLKRGEPLEGQWLRAHQYVDAYHKQAVKLQNPDGSFSTNWFKGPGAKRDVDRRVQTTGHILEWLVFSLPEDELTDPRIVRAVTYLNAIMLEYRRRDWKHGHRGHALRALALYNERVFGDKPGERRDLLAQDPVK